MLFEYILKDSEIGELYELVCRREGQETVDQLIKEGKATAIEVGNAVFVQVRKLEWSEHTNINRMVAIGGVSQDPKALGNIDLESMASMFDDMITNTTHSDLDIGDGRLMRIQQATRSLGQQHMQQLMPPMSGSGAIIGVPMQHDGTITSANM